MSKSNLAKNGYRREVKTVHLAGLIWFLGQMSVETAH
jgi:hypothetical protein